MAELGRPLNITPDTSGPDTLAVAMDPDACLSICAYPDEPRAIVLVVSSPNSGLSLGYPACAHRLRTIAAELERIAAGLPACGGNHDDDGEPES